MNKNYLLALDVMTLLQNDKLPEIGKSYKGVFTRTNEWDASFEEFPKCKTDGKRNITICVGKYLNCTIRPDDLHVRLNFKELNFGSDFDIEVFAVELMIEARKMLNDVNYLIEEIKAE